MRQRRSEATSKAPATTKVARTAWEALRLNQLRTRDFLIPVALMLIGVLFWLNSEPSDYTDIGPSFREEHMMIQKGLEMNTAESIAEHALKQIKEKMWQQDAIRLGHATEEDFNKPKEPEPERERDDYEGQHRKNFSLVKLAGQMLLFFGGAFALLAFWSSM